MNILAWFGSLFSSSRSAGEANHKYVALILQESSYWATYRPQQAFGAQVGDYGVVEKDMGEFVRVGNIYEDDAIVKQVPELKNSSLKPKECVGLNKSVIAAKTAHKVNMSAGPKA
ncbi:hypothetical protein BD311DRAFT_743713 [Dichomitus squalens]|uniref:Uncharacterized protein n=1 Tax=Dichomitus squalens TaxID=114155 RepID=A0A4Q9M6K5_9APHY|nr:hypothetical protein BD311DRAFT_743713 [Dichomitus squalens]